MTAVYAATVRGEYIRHVAAAAEKNLAAPVRAARSSANE
jgi:hypothetical protein